MINWRSDHRCGVAGSLSHPTQNQLACQCSERPNSWQPRQTPFRLGENAQSRGCGSDSAVSRVAPICLSRPHRARSFGPRRQAGTRRRKPSRSSPCARSQPVKNSTGALRPQRAGCALSWRTRTTLRRVPNWQTRHARQIPADRRSFMLACHPQLNRALRPRLRAPERVRQSRRQVPRRGLRPARASQRGGIGRVHRALLHTVRVHSSSRRRRRRKWVGQGLAFADVPGRSVLHC